jgi:anti-sigma B factor antagonist
MFKRADTPTSAEYGHDASAIVRRDLDDRTSVIAVEGDLDLSTAPRLKSMLIDALESGHDKLVVDLSLATFMDSTALSVLVGINRRLASGARLAIACTRPNVLQVFEFSGTDRAFAIHPTLEDALAHGFEHHAQTG